MMERETLVSTVLVVLVGVAAFLAPTYTVNGFSVNVAVLIGVFIGVLSGGVGMGGVWLMVPLLTFFFGTGIKQAIGTALTAQVFITFFGSYEHFHEKSTGLKVATPLIIGGVVGTPVGTWLNVRAADTVLSWIYVALLLGMAAKIGFERFSTSGAADMVEGRDLSGEVFGAEHVEQVEEKMRDGVDTLGQVGEAVEEHVPEKITDEYEGEPYTVDTVSLFVAGVFFGVVNSLLGTSSTLIVPFLDVVMHLSTHVATVAGLITVTGISVPAAANHFFVGNVSMFLAAALVGGGLIGSWLGSNVSHRLDPGQIQVFLIFLLVAMSYYMLPVTPF